MATQKHLNCDYHILYCGNGPLLGVLGAVLQELCFLFVHTLGVVATRQHDDVSAGHAAGATVALNPHCRPNHTESPVKVPIKDLGVLPWVGSCPAVFQ